MQIVIYLRVMPFDLKQYFQHVFYDFLNNLEQFILKL